MDSEESGQKMIESVHGLSVKNAKVLFCTPHLLNNLFISPFPTPHSANMKQIDKN